MAGEVVKDQTKFPIEFQVGDGALQGMEFVSVPVDINATSVDAFNDQQTEGLRATLMRLRAEGGGDIPADVFGALRRTTTLGWTSRRRYAVLIADAPPHGARFIGSQTMQDDHPTASNEADIIIEGSNGLQAD